MASKLEPLFSSKNEHWNTPEDVLSAIYGFCNGPVGLDPCSNETSIVKSDRAFTIEDDGLSLSWACDGLVFVNPPYGRGIGAWISKCEDSYFFDGSEVIALVPARTDPKWFQDYAPRMTMILFWAGRLRFLGAKSSAPFPSMLLYWGDRPNRFRFAFRSLGVSVEPLSIGGS